MTHGLVNNVNSSILPEVCQYGRRARSSTSNVNMSLSTLASFKSATFNYYKSALAVSYDCEDPRSFKSMCLKCNSARPITCRM